MDGEGNRSRIQLATGASITIVRSGEVFRISVLAPVDVVLTRSEMWRLIEAMDDLATRA